MTGLAVVARPAILSLQSGAANPQRSLLGTLACWPDRIGYVLSKHGDLKPEDFEAGDLRDLFATMIELYDAGQEIDADALSPHLSDVAIELTDDAWPPSDLRLDELAGAVRAASILRAIRVGADDLIRHADAGDLPGAVSMVEHLAGVVRRLAA